MAIVDRRKHRRSREDRRRYPRVSFSLSGFYTSASSALMFERGNLNLRGFFLPTCLPDRVGTRGTFRLEVPGARTMMRLPVRVVWANQDPAHGRLGMGLRVEQSESFQRKRLAAFMLRREGLRVFPAVDRLHRD